VSSSIGKSEGGEESLGAEGEESLRGEERKK
jgi:hypothetical protein